MKIINGDSLEVLKRATAKTECTECKGSKKMYVNQFYEEENTIPCIYCKGTGTTETKCECTNFSKDIIDTSYCKLHRDIVSLTTETTLEERFTEQFKKQFIDGGIAVLLDYPPHERVLDEGRTLDFIKQEIALAVQQERERILQKAKDILDKESEYYGTDKHGLSYEQLEYIIKAINQDHE